jgi:ketosteroid isomerase-like protein
MTRTSQRALVAATALLLASAILYFRSQDTPAPPLTARVVDATLTEVARAIRRRDAAGAFGFVTEDAELFGARRARLERYAARTLREAAPGRLNLSWHDIVVTDHGPTGAAEFDVTVGERIGDTDTVYFQSRITLYFRKVRVTRWLGLGTEERWLVERAQSSSDVFTGE